MQILEVKNDTAKITYNPAENRLLPSDFLLIEDVNQKLIAQIINIETTDKSDENLAILRLALSIDKEDNLSYFNGYIPSKTSKLIYITPDEIIELVQGNDKNIYWGNLSNHPSCFVKTSMSYVDERLYIQSDRNDKTQIVVENIVAELKNKNKKVIIIDFNGQYNSVPDELKLKISNDIKLPLNIEAFDTILQYDTVDCPIEDKAVIQSIVLELREYLRTLKDKFIPFEMFKNVVDNEFESNPVSGLMLLRNKLWLYAQDGIFANNKQEFDVINSMFFNQNIIVVDASELEEKWFKFVIQTVAGLTNHNCYLFLSLNDIEIDKKSIIGLYNKENILPIISTSYDSPYRPILKSLCKNYLLCKPSAYINEEAHYAPLINRMNNNDFILYGETTLNLPLILELQPFDESTNENVSQNEIRRNVDKFLSSPQTVIPKTNGVVSDDEQVDYDLDEEFEAEAVDDDSVEEIEAVEADDVDDDDEISFDEEPLINFEEEAAQVQSPTEEEEFKDSDLDFLDEVAENKPVSSDDDDILNVPFELSYDNQNGSASMLSGTGYGVFNPVAADLNVNSTFVEKITADSLNLLESDENKTPAVDKTAENSQIQELPDDILLENIQEENDDILLEEEEKQDDDELTSIDDILDEITSNQTQTVEKDENDLPVETVEEDLEENIEVASVEEMQEQSENNVDSNFEIELETEDEEEEEEEEEEQPVVEKVVAKKVQETKPQVAPPPVKENIVSREPQQVPIYETDIPQTESAEDVPFKVGDRVYHPKHGNGVIEAFSSYSNRILFCHILFDNVGRKIMDPRVSCIEKVS